MSLVDARYDLAATIAATVGETVTVTIDPTAINPPCIFVGAPANLVRGPCGLYGDCPVWVIMPGPGNLDVLEPALDLVEAIAAVVDVNGPINPDSFAPDPTGATSLPAYLLTVALNS